MFAAWLLYEDHFRDAYFPDTRSWTSQIVLTQMETGWNYDAVFGVRMLEGKLYFTIPKGFRWDDGSDVSERRVPLSSYFKVLRQDGLPMEIAFQQIDKNSLCFTKYRLPQRQVTFGKDPNCDVCQDDSIISGKHGAITFSGGVAQYTDASKNGTYYNGRRVRGSSIQLSFGDVLTFPTGVKVVVLANALAINSAAPLRHVRLERLKLRQVPPPPEHLPDLPAVHVEYHRAPRMLLRAEIAEVDIEPPLNKEESKLPPLWQQIGPSATMILPMAAGISVGAMSGRGMSWAGLAMIGTSSMLAVMWGLINRNHNNKALAQAEQARQELYRRYIAEMDGQLKTLSEREHRRLMENFPNVGQSAALPANLQSRQLWNRMPSHPDFLELRLGTGDVPLPGEITFQKKKLSIIGDPLRDEPERLKRTYDTIHNAPVTVKLRGESVIGILGGDEAVLFAQGLLMQIAALHSYHDVRIAVLTDEASASQWDWVRWLPHVFASEDRELRMLASKPSSIHDIMSHLDEVLAMRRGGEDEAADLPIADDEDFDASTLPLPHYMIFCTDYRLLEDEPIMRRLLTARLGMTLVMVASSMEMLPKESHLIVNLTGKPGFLHTSEGDTRVVDFEYPNRRLLEDFAHKIAPLRVHDAVESAAIPTLVSFLDIYGARRVEDLDVWRMWSENHTYDGLRSIIGYTAGSRPFVLDISEKYHGPHGLIAGTTGSGKSVMLQTYILSLALNYSPEQVQFILIDYKGGGMADAFRTLPHVAGIIDNLQGEQVISRALASLNGEIHRREVLFKEVGVKDITDYTRQYGEDAGEVKLPHLIIIADEFAELKSDQPEFMKELVSASRVGRSLGVHLILATQKPSASVSDEIWANSRFHLCLRVQTVADSRDMLKRPDAAYIKGTGRCFIQIGNDESFDQVQTCYSGLPYDPNVARPEEMPHLLGDAGQTINVPKKRATQQKSNERVPTQMDAVLERIGRVAQEHNMTRARKMWLPEMGERIPFSTLRLFHDIRTRSGRYVNAPEGVSFLLGLADDTANQRYLPYVINLSDMRNLMLVGLAGSGKTTAVQSIVYSLCNTYDPAHLNIYILSLTSQTLGALSAFPHVGDIAFDGEKVEIKRFINMLTRESQRRGDLFAQASTDSFIEYNRAQVAKGAPPVPAAVVFIDRFEQLRTMFDADEAMTARIHALIREGSSRGIHFVVTALAKNEVPYKLHPFFSGIGLQLNERADYAEVIGRRVPYDMPPIARNAGRALAPLGSNLYEIQLGIAGPDIQAPPPSRFGSLTDAPRYFIEQPMGQIPIQTDTDRAALITRFAKALRDQWTGALPKPIPRIPENATWEMFSQAEGFAELQKTDYQLPLGYDMDKGVPVALDTEENFSMFITGPKRSGRTNFLKHVARTWMDRGAEVHVIGDTEWTDAAKAFGFKLYQDRKQILEYVHAFQEGVLRDDRRPKRAAALTEGKAALKKVALTFKPYVIIVDNAQRFNTDFNDLELGTELKFLKDLFSQLCSRADHYNLHLYLSAPYSAQSYFTQEPLRSLIAQGRGLSLGGKVSECNPLGIAGMMTSAQARAPQPAGNGYLRTEAGLTQVVVPLAET